MRLWSINPCYLDSKGLVALWRESLLAQSCLLKGEYTVCSHCKGESVNWIEGTCPICMTRGKIKTPYYNHPQLIRWKQKPIESLKNYLYCIYEEAKNRQYNFDVTKINLKHEDWICDCPNDECFLTVTKGQLVFEISHLLKKLKIRDRKKYLEVSKEIEWREGANHLYYNENKIKANPIFKIIEGDVESWEKIK